MERSCRGHSSQSLVESVISDPQINVFMLSVDPNECLGSWQR